MIKSCQICSAEFKVKPSQVRYGYGKFCSKKCKTESQKRRVQIKCFACGTEKVIKHSDANKAEEHNFCSRKCAIGWKNKNASGENHPNWTDGAATYRKRALEHYGKKCSNTSCKLANILNIPEKLLDVDHIDSNRSNNDLQNLQVLCVLCHAIKTRKVTL